MDHRRDVLPAQDGGVPSGALVLTFGGALLRGCRFPLGSLRLNLPRSYPHDMDGVADDIGGALGTCWSLWHEASLP